MWNYPKSAKHELKANHDRELARVRAAEKKQMRGVDTQQALDEIKAKMTATRAHAARLRAERLARAAAKPAGSAKAKVLGIGHFAENLPLEKEASGREVINYGYLIPGPWGSSPACWIAMPRSHMSIHSPHPEH